MESGVKLQGEFPGLQLSPDILFRDHTQYPTAHQTFQLKLPREGGTSHFSATTLLPAATLVLDSTFSAGQQTDEHIPDSVSSVPHKHCYTCAKDQTPTISHLDHGL